LSRRGYTSRPPIPEEREVHRLHTEKVKKQKDAAEVAVARKRKRKEKHDKACKIARAEGKPQPATPKSSEEEGEDSSDVELNFSDDDEAATGADSPTVYRGAGDEEVLVMLGEVRLTPVSLVDPPLVGAGRRSPTPAAGGSSSMPVTGQRSFPPATGRTPAPAVSTGDGGSAVSAEMSVQMASRLQGDPRMTPIGQSSRAVSVPWARRSGSGKRSMSARSG
jgi:hypothetical protein